MEHKDLKNPGRGANLNQKNNAQRNGPAVPEEYGGGKSPEERAKDVGEAEAEDFFRTDKQRQRIKKPGSTEHLPSED